ncbi:epithelial cell adhesion molecule-like isoform X2 [Mixophyes fleayi]|uniref:epithelial cell adhesion molecule-like isoform X2 n=1 Tax=Mixophyes fleayi TaxID=3061075 RepID=UPI003F4E3CB5
MSDCPAPATDDECPDALPAHENCDYDEVCEDSLCQYNEFVTCHLNRCGTCEAVYSGYDNMTVNCNQLTPKCRLMHLEMLHKSRRGRSHPGRGRVEVDNVYDPDCEENGAFKAKQCDEDTNLCWCVDSAGARVTDKTSDDPKCDRLVSVHLIQIDFIFRTEFALVKGSEEELRRKLTSKVSRFILKAPQILQVTIHELLHGVTMKLFSTNGTKDPVDIATVAYYIERDLKQSKFTLPVDGQNLEVDPDSIRVLFFDNEPPRINMKSISPGFSAIIIIIALAILTGIAVTGHELEDHHLAQRDGLRYYD